MMGHKERLKSGDEYDKILFRSPYRYLRKASRKIKKKVNRRERRKNKMRRKDDIL
jgi:hypothetical protein